MDPAPPGTTTGWFEWILGVMTMVLGTLGWNTMSRVARLEEVSQTKSDAASTRAEIRDELQQTRQEMAAQHERLYDKLDDLRNDIMELLHKK